MNHDEQIKLLWNTYRDGIKNNSEIAEKYFVDVLKLIITLSTGMLAFIVAIQDKILNGTLRIEIIILICSFIMAIILAIFSFVLLASHYKTYADNSYRDLRNLYESLRGNQIEKVKNKIKQNEDDYWSQKDSGWQHSTMILGIFSFVFFIFGIGFLMTSFVLQYKHYY